MQNRITEAEITTSSPAIAKQVLGGVIRPAKEMKIDLKDEVKVGDTTMFNVGGKMVAVEIIQINGCNLKLMSCDLKNVWDNVSLSHWLRQVEFMKQLP
jgi:hypothetical protein